MVSFASTSHQNFGAWLTEEASLVDAWVGDRVDFKGN
jgi:hypothetical protein